MSSELVDLRSDTVTRPSEGMRKAMYAAEVGDDVFGDDPTVIRLQSVAAERLGFADALFCPSATQANLVSLMTHCQRGEEVIVGSHAHTYAYEAGGAAVAGSIHSHVIENAADGTLPLGEIEAAVRPDDVHFPHTRLLALENTYSGRVLPLAYCTEATALARRHSLSTHLDGSRLFNAAVALQVAPAQVCKTFRLASTPYGQKSAPISFSVSCISLVTHGSPILSALTSRNSASDMRLASLNALSRLAASHWFCSTSWRRTPTTCMIGNIFVRRK